MPQGSFRKSKNAVRNLKGKKKIVVLTVLLKDI